MAFATKKPDIEQLVKDVGGNQYGISAAAMMFRMGGPTRARKYINLLKGSRHLKLQAINRRGQ
jgi:hypothetical protein